MYFLITTLGCFGFWVMIAKCIAPNTNYIIDVFSGYHSEWKINTLEKITKLENKILSIDMPLVEKLKLRDHNITYNSFGIDIDAYHEYLIDCSHIIDNYLLLVKASN